MRGGERKTDRQIHRQTDKYTDRHRRWIIIFVGEGGGWSETYFGDFILYN